MKVLSVVLSAVCAIQVASGKDIEKRKLQTENHPVCYEIYNSWWPSRESQKIRQSVVSLDATCSRFSNQADQCNYKSARAGVLSGEEEKASCTVIGAHNKTCIANPCNHLNTGDCTLQATGGMCKWWTRSETKTVNQYWRKMANAARKSGDEEKAKEYEDRLLPGFGCHRNPCNRPGQGRSPEGSCSTGDFDVPGLYSCTWCKSAGDPILQGSGMGCQMTSVSTTARCAPVNPRLVDRSSIFRETKSRRRKCQCSNEYPVCEGILSEDSRSPNGQRKYKRRFK